MKNPQAKIILSFLFAAVGGYALLSQTLFFREFMAVYSGSELAVGVVFSCWLLGVTAGAYCGRLWISTTESPENLFFVSLLFLIVLPPAFLFPARISGSIFVLPVGQLAPLDIMIKSAAAFVFPASLPVGFCFPAAAAMAEKMGFGQKSVGALYSFEAFGSTLAGVIFTYFMAGEVPPFLGLSAFAGVLCLAGAVLAVSKRKRIFAAIHTVLFVIIVSATTFGGIWRVEQLGLAIQQQTEAPGLIHEKSRDTKYQRVEIFSLQGQTSVYGNGQVFATFPDPTAESFAANLVACQHQNPQTILIVGSGMESALRFLPAHGIREIVQLDIDGQAGEMIRNRIFKKGENPAPGAKVTFLEEDGRQFIRSTDQHFDIIWLALADPSNAMLNRFYTREFFLQAEKVLNRDGIICMTLSSAVNYVGQEVGDYVASIEGTLASVFSETLILPGDKAWVFASKSKETLSARWEVLRDRYEGRGIGQAEFSPFLFKMNMSPERIEGFRRMLVAYRDVPINSDDHPITYYFHMLLQERFTGGNFGPLLRKLRGIGAAFPGFIAFFSSALVGAWMLLKRRKAGGSLFAVTGEWAIFSTGCAGMGLNVVLLLAYQNHHGALFEQVGLLVALYMLGLMLGGGVVTAFSERADFRTLKWIIVTEVALILSACCIPFLAGVYLPPAAYYLGVLIVGGFAGAQFPLCARFAARDVDSTGTLAGRIDFADHLGAFFGASLTGVIFVPIFGLSASCLIFALLKAGSLGLMIILRFQQKAGIR